MNIKYFYFIDKYNIDEDGSVKMDIDFDKTTVHLKLNNKQCCDVKRLDNQFQSEWTQLTFSGQYIDISTMYKLCKECTSSKLYRITKKLEKI